jgi:3-deoxy-D-manno-octulosonate 8-phosphate phosphatase (KDO 8-P phosphatase)
MGPGIEAKARAVRLAIFDVDGIMTDGTLWITDSGEEFKGFNTRDGHGLKMLQESGITLAILSGRRSRCVENRARDLGIAHVLQGISRKQEGFDLLLRAVGVEASQTAYMGDDLVDLPVLRRCGLSATVPEAPDLVRRHADHVTVAAGGRGAVREFCELIMRLQGTLEAQWSQYLA